MACLACIKKSKRELHWCCEKCGDGCWCYKKSREERRRKKMKDETQKIKKQLEEAGYDNATAIATKAEIEAGAACGQLSIIADGKDEEDEG